MTFTEEEYNSISYLEGKLSQLQAIVTGHERMIDTLEEEIREVEGKLDQIIDKARKRDIEKCKHRMNEYTELGYHGSCGYEWCIFSEYHRHRHCQECGYVEGEPLSL